MNAPNVDKLLNRYGLICHTFAYNKLPDAIKNKLNFEKENKAALSEHKAKVLSNKYISLLANVGPSFWNHLTSFYAHRNITANSEHDWFDERSITIVDELCKASGKQIETNILYPGNHPAPLISLGELAGWSTPSPLGLGINSTYGPWFAYRALFVTDEPITHEIKPKSSHPTNIKSPCITCSAPCTTACPAGAVVIDEPFDIRACATHRAKSDSNCQTQCHARNACPVGTSFQYPEEQRAYHMTHALQAIIDWAATK